MSTNWSWSVFFTLTFKEPVSLTRAERLAFGRACSRPGWCVGSVESRGGYWVAAIEEHRLERAGQPHVHGIAGGFVDGDPRVVAMWQEWRIFDGGRARVELVRCAADVARYVSKYTLKGVAKWYDGGELQRRAGEAFQLASTETRVRDVASLPASESASASVQLNPR